MKTASCNGKQCVHPEPDCTAAMQKDGFYYGCTLSVGHDGPHVACTMTRHNIAVSAPTREHQTTAP